jgi:hypothetical protein
MRRRGAPGQKTKALGAGRVWPYAWFDRVGYTVDRAAFRREFPDVAFHDFESWAKAQDWNTPALRIPGVEFRIIFIAALTYILWRFIMKR